MRRPWKKVVVGDFVHVGCNEILPADILLVRSSDPNGVCYVETSNLDGESTLKQKQCIPSYMPELGDANAPPAYRSDTNKVKDIFERI